MINEVGLALVVAGFCLGEALKNKNASNVESLFVFIIWALFCFCARISIKDKKEV